MPPLVPLRSTLPLFAPVFPDRGARRGRRDPVFPGLPPQQWLWPTPVFPPIPPRRWAQLFVAGPGWDLLPVYPAGPSVRWERLLPGVRGKQGLRRQNVPTWAGSRNW